MRIIVTYIWTYLWTENVDLTLNDGMMGWFRIFDHNLRSMFTSAVF